MVALRPTLEMLPPMLRRYVELKDSTGQLVQFFAMLSGLKPVLDDWIKVERLADFGSFARDLGLAWQIESRWDFLDDLKPLRGVIGGEFMNTTVAIGHASTSSAGKVAHVVISREPELVARARASGWYELVVGRRRIGKPWIDHERYGELLGYPECCRRIFATHNDWNRDNTLYQAWARTQRVQPLCNTLMKHAGLTFACHLPCSFDCQATTSAARAVRTSLGREAKDLQSLVDDLARRPYLVLSEWEAYGFEGSVDASGSVSYASVFEAPSNRPDRALLAKLEAGDSVRIVGDALQISRQGVVVATYATRAERFGPQVPFIVDFAADGEP
jgi:hypothetical protein